MTQRVLSTNLHYHVARPGSSDIVAGTLRVPSAIWSAAIYRRFPISVRHSVLLQTVFEQGKKSGDKSPHSKSKAKIKFPTPKAYESSQRFARPLLQTGWPIDVARGRSL